MGRVHAPSIGESLRMTYTGVKNRLGRTCVTLLGIVLGIAFLMSALVTSNIRGSLRGVTDRRADVQSMYAVMRAEIGELASKKIVLVAEQPAKRQQLLTDLIAELNRRVGDLELVGSLTPEAVGADPQVFANASGVIAWIPSAGDVPTAHWGAHVTKMKQSVVLVFGDASAFASLSAMGVRVKDLLPKLNASQQQRRRAEIAERKTRMRWLTVVSLLVATIGISNALLMSVTERYRDIGTMKCLGALNSFITRLILLESSFLGAVGALAGVALGSVFAIAGYSSTYGTDTVLAAIDGRDLMVAAMLCLVLGWLVSVIAAIYPARVAVRMVPADALRTEI